MQSSVDVAVEILKDLEEFNRSGSKEGFRKQLRKEFVRRSGAVSLDEAGYGFGLSGPFPGDDPYSYVRVRRRSTARAGLAFMQQDTVAHLAPRRRTNTAEHCRTGR